MTAQTILISSLSLVKIEIRQPGLITALLESGQRATMMFRIFYLIILTDINNVDSYINNITIKNMVPRTGIEPVTQGFSVLCSTNWATWALKIVIKCFRY